MTSNDPASVSIRPVRREDLAAVAALIHPFVEQGQLLPRTENELDDLLEHGFVAAAKDRVVGFAALEIYSSKMAEVRSLAVAGEYSGQGVGKRLVEACVQRAREKEVREVIAITSSEHFFKACGFDFTLPGEKKALFIQPTATEPRP